MARKLEILICLQNWWETFTANWKLCRALSWCQTHTQWLKVLRKPSVKRVDYLDITPNLLSGTFKQIVKYFIRISSFKSSLSFLSWSTARTQYSAYGFPPSSVTTAILHNSLPSSNWTYLWFSPYPFPHILGNTGIAFVIFYLSLRLIRIA